MKPGTKPLPTHLKVVKGTINHSRTNKREPKINLRKGPPIPPDWLDKEAQLEWIRQCEDLHESGILTKIDRVAFAAYCQAYSRWMAAELVLQEMAKRDEATRGFMIRTINGNVIQNPAVGSANTAMRDCVRYACELGMTPSSRSRIIAQVPEEADDPAKKYLA